MATAELIPPLFQVETVKKMVDRGYVNLKLTPDEASSLARLAMAAVCWDASGAFGERIEAIYKALVAAKVPEESGLVVADCVENLPNARPYPLQRTWGSPV